MNAYERLIVQALREAASYSRIPARKGEYLKTAKSVEQGALVVTEKKNVKGE